MPTGNGQCIQPLRIGRLPSWTSAGSSSLLLEPPFLHRGTNASTNVLRSYACTHACAGTAHRWQTGFAVALRFRVSWVSGPSAGDFQQLMLARPVLRWLREIGLSWLTCRYSIGMALRPVMLSTPYDILFGQAPRRKICEAMLAMSNTRSSAKTKPDARQRQHDFEASHSFQDTRHNYRSFSP